MGLKADFFTIWSHSVYTYTFPSRTSIYPLNGRLRRRGGGGAPLHLKKKKLTSIKTHAK